MQKVFVALSGGVDSSVSAALLQQQGYAVTGVFIKTWHPDFLECTWRDERHDAMRVCAHLGIPFYTLDLEEEYKRNVAEYMIESYRMGQTPNPDVMCNQHIKFGGFFEYAMAQGADMIATGHYARVVQRTSGTVALFAGVDTAKDQSYFLYRVPQDVLQKTVFPVGGYEKQKVREIARTFGLETAEKKDSQGVCFLGHVAMQDFLKRYITVVPGDVLNEQGEVIGVHEGAILYTIGQRHGFTVTKKGPHDGPYYVASRNIEKNTIIASQDFKIKKDFAVALCTIHDTHWISGIAPETYKEYQCRFRYRQTLQKCTVTYTPDATTVHFQEPQRALNAGQSLVVYDGEVCLGGGVIV